MRIKVTFGDYPVEVEGSDEKELETALEIALRVIQRNDVLPVGKARHREFKQSSEPQDPIVSPQEGLVLPGGETSEDNGMVPQSHIFKDAKSQADYIYAALKDLCATFGPRWYSYTQVYNHLKATGGSHIIKDKKPNRAISQVAKENDEFVRKHGGGIALSKWKLEDKPETLFQEKF